MHYNNIGYHYKKKDGFLLNRILNYMLINNYAIDELEFWITLYCHPVVE